MASNYWGPEIAGAYDETSADMYDPSVLDPTVQVLSELARGGPALEFAIGTGRVALPLAAGGVPVSGLELSRHMVDQLTRKPGSDAIPVTIGDMSTARVPGIFRLVYLVFNSIMNATTQDEQLAVFTNAAGHLEPGGYFVVEVCVPQSAPRGESGRIFALEDHHVGIDTFDDQIGQITSSHHWFSVDDRLIHHSAPYRYVWPSELLLMGRVAGLRLKYRWAGWDKSEFGSDSTSQVAVFEKV